MVIFNFSQYASILPDNEKNYKNNFIRDKNRIGDIIKVFREKVFSIRYNLNIFLARVGALGCEVLKNFVYWELILD